MQEAAGWGDIGAWGDLGAALFGSLGRPSRGGHATTMISLIQCFQKLISRREFENRRCVRAVFFVFGLFLYVF